MNYISRLVLFLALVILIGCGGSGSSNPVEPENVPADSSLLSLQQSRPGLNSNRYLWGYWQIRIDAENETAEVIPMRNTELHLNTVRLLEVAPCTVCLSILGITYGPGNQVKATLRLFHPYPGYKRLTGFDVRGIFITGGDYYFPEFNRFLSWNGDHPRMIHEDGYTSLFNPTEFPETQPGPPALRYIPGVSAPGGDLTSTCNPYIAYAKWAPRRMFASGSALDEEVTILLADGPAEFGYAVDACWQKVDGPVTDPENDFPPDANCLEAYEIDVTVGAGLGKVSGTYAPIEVEVFDHQGLETISTVSVEVPELFGGTVNLSYDSDAGPDCYRFTGTIHNNFGTDAGEHPMLVRVIDWDPDQNLGQIDAWQLFPVEIPEVGKPVAVAAFEPDPGLVCEDVYFYDDGSFDSDGGPIVQYEWDWNNDGVYDTEGDSVYHSWDEVGTYYVQFRVTDDEGETDTLNEPLQISIISLPPTAVAEASNVSAYVGEPITFDAGDSHDNDCNGDLIVLYRWDFEGSGIWEDYFDPSVEYSYDSAGEYEVMLEIEDDEAEVDQIDEPIIVNVSLGDLEPIAIASADPSTQNVGEPVYFSDDGSYDPDFGDLILYEWDLDNDGTFETPGQDTLFTWEIPGTYYVQFRVTDDELDTDTLDDPLEITIKEPGGWAVNWGADDYDYGFAVALDNEGNIYVTGIFQETIDFDPGPGEDFRTAPGEDAIFLSRFSADGEFAWVRTWGGNNDNHTEEISNAVVVDEWNNVYVTGYVDGLCDYDPGPGEDWIQSLDQDMFLCKYDTLGNYYWAKVWGSDDHHERGFSVDVDHLGDIYVSGEWQETCDFDPGPGEDIKVAVDSGDIFYSKFSPDGTYLFSRVWGSTSDDHPSGIGTDSNGNFYITGFFSHDVDFDPGPGEAWCTALDGKDVFLSSFTIDGDFRWVGCWGGSSNDIGLGLVVGNSEVLITGEFRDTVDFDPGPGEASFTASGISDCFINRLDFNGNYIQALVFGGPDADACAAIDIDDFGNFNVTGYYSGLADMDPGPGVVELLSVGHEDIFVSKFAPDGSLLWSRGFGGQYDDLGWGIRIGSSGESYLTGWFHYDADFDPTLATYTLTSNGEEDVFLSMIPSDGNW